MKLNRLSLLPIILLLLVCIEKTSAFEVTQYSGINRIEFNNNQYDKEFVGNGFLLNHKGKTYALTVKHTLLEAKTPKMQFIDIKDHVKSWQIHPNKKPQHSVQLGKLLNSDANEPIDMKILEKDWLVFEVISNNSNLVPLTLRESDIQKGEQLTAYGCSYANKMTCSQDQYVGHFVSSESNNLRISLPNLELNKLRGLSGSPVLDSKGRLVGIVSNILRSKDGDGFDFAPANLNYLTSILNQVKNE